MKGSTRLHLLRLLPAVLLAVILAGAYGVAQEAKPGAQKPEKREQGKEEPKAQAKPESEPGKAPAAAGIIAGKIETLPGKYAKDVLVYIKEIKGTFSPPEKKPEMNQKNLIFDPHVLPVLAGSTVEFLNSDTVLHNVFSPDNEKYNLGSWAKGETKAYTFKKPGVYTQLCNVHPEMQAYIVVLQNLFWSKVGEKDSYKIDKVPPGHYTLVCWSERLKGAEKEVDVKAGESLTVDFSLRGRK